MSHRCLAALCLGMAIVMLAPPAAAGQSQGAAEPPRTPDGQPDLSGVWDFRTVTPLERPAELADQAFFTTEEAAAFAERRVRESNVDLNRATTTTAREVVNGTRESVDLAAAYNNFWYDRGTTAVVTGRTSLVVDPPDGRIPMLTPEAQARVAARVERSRRITEGPEDRPLGERCIVRPNAGPPLTPAGYNNNVQIFQTPGHVVLFAEQIHDSRVVPTDGRPHLPQRLRQWMGDSRGRWEGETFVVETTNFNDRKYFRGAGGNMHLVERFTRLDADTLLYEFTVSDPQSFTRPWTAQIPMKRNPDPIYEYACHEGNYGMEGTLSGAGRIPDFPVTRSHPPASWPSAANSSICRTYRKTAGEESRRRSPVANRWMRP